MQKYTRWITLRVQASLAMADHYPDSAQHEKYAFMNVGPWWKANLKSMVSDH